MAYLKTHKIKELLANPVMVTGAIFLISIMSLIFVLVSQYVFGFEPCILCIYQRVPYVITALMGITGLILLHREKIRATTNLILLCAVIFFAESLLAFYHVGVEQHWWRSIFESCAAPDLTGSASDILKLIEQAQAVPCDQVAWRFLGLSMATHNIFLALVLALGCLLSYLTLNKTPYELKPANSK